MIFRSTYYQINLAILIFWETKTTKSYRKVYSLSMKIVRALVRMIKGLVGPSLHICNISLEDAKLWAIPPPTYNIFRAHLHLQGPPWAEPEIIVLYLNIHTTSVEHSGVVFIKNRCSYRDVEPISRSYSGDSQDQ